MSEIKLELFKYDKIYICLQFVIDGSRHRRISLGLLEVSRGIGSVLKCRLAELQDFM